MKIEFKKIILHNFLSYGHSEIELFNKGYCLVNGINRCPKDNATSNGSGKSSWVSAICWCLTGETIQGLTKDIKNIYIDEDLCYVELTFKYDSDEYIITRFNKPKSDLKININGIDKSGKGIRESELLLASYIPDLSINLISSVILLGQGLPNKLSAHTPSGRKELLEKLSKSDFMIEDIKNRISDRTNVLTNKINEINNNLLKISTSIEIYKPKLENLVSTKDKLSSVDYDNELNILNSQLERNRELLQKNETDLSVLRQEAVELYNSFSSISQSKQVELDDELQKYQTKKDALYEEKSNYQSQLESSKIELTKLKSIKDVCPTCGQKLVGVVKPDTTKLEQDIITIDNNITRLKNEINVINTKHDNYVADINAYYKDALDETNNKIAQYNSNVNTLESNINHLRNLILQDEKSEIELKSKKDNLRIQQEKILEEINQTQLLLDTLVNDSSNLNENKASLQSHLEVVKKIDTLVKRDFRGYLLSNVIDFINQKAKEYCEYIFGSTEFDFSLDGNNINISYCNKPFESLSGGEKQKIDLILQFTIREMLSQYLNFSSNILVLDEIFDNLDAQSTSNVLNMISNKLNDIESLFIISHHADELSIPSDYILTIEKNEQGISEVK